MDGIINVYKEKDYTSFDVVAKLRGILKQKKIGHTGTLDPNATGVLPVCLGCGTKLCDMLTDTTKVYQAQMLLGVVTDTQDTTGTVLKRKDVNVSEEEIREIIFSFIGVQEQLPPMYSAKKVNGKKLYELAREGKEVERSPHQIQIDQIEILNCDIPQIEIRVTCSKGTYIRTLIHDIGTKAGCGATMSELVRCKTAGFFIQDAKTLAEIEELVQKGRIDDIVYPVDAVFENLRGFHIEESAIKYADNGNKLYVSQLCENPDLKAEERIRIYSKELFYGIYEYDGEELCKPVKLFFAKRSI